MNEETMKVLKMLEEGKIDSEKAGELIDALAPSKNLVPVSPTINIDKMLKIRVNSHKGDNVNINVPVKFINTLGTAIKKIPKVEGVEGLEEIDIQAILQAVSEGLDGKIVDVQSEQGDIVEIIVE
ncbi:SHOCT-like domain-containing protein [Clostridium omnivorum]|uniref:YvlB/LiaX N-terminal domain-containing protein n=1 Tax=Clostridium omnivorum TaxID=1604902 RepID=A0ABQ5N587_9CLOT|nr:hypothetical protein [Clostridium sp. E14]GLC30382.1 hypothetical protein bsdE14_17920 [Clostridium sp. E14]